MENWLRGFYGVVDVRAGGDCDEAVRLADALIAGGARVVQLRMKGASTHEFFVVGTCLRQLTAQAGVALVVNDRIDVARAVEADGVHLGQDDLPLAAARMASAPPRSARVGTDLVIGISTHTMAQVKAAAAAGADYLGFGPVFATRTKANPDPVQGLAALAKAVALAHPVPVVAIGGITPDNVAQVAATGARAACAISSVNNAADVTRAAAHIAGAFALTPTRFPLHQDVGDFVVEHGKLEGLVEVSVDSVKR